MTRPMVRWSAVELARALGQSHEPTPEQAAVIEAPLRPLLVIAGAGSGKTETMAARVVWLVANGMVEPEEVLGLTFTRKAATELGERLASRLARLRQQGLWTPRAEGGAAALPGTPTVSTYHAYAGGLVRQHGLRLGVEPESRLLSEAALWQLAHETVLAYDGPMEAVDLAESTITSAVIDLAGECAEHLLDVNDVEDHLREVIATLEAVPAAASGRSKGLPADVRTAVGVLRKRLAVLPIVRELAAAKSRRDALDFGDQVALAARLAAEFPDVGAAERGRFRAVLLDEFQDTSEAQLAFLHGVFVADGESVPVTAVGDPHQAIYGWRGASATTLDRYTALFRDPDPATVLPLSTSWRNDEAILASANVVAEPLVASSRIPVRRLAARPTAGTGHVLTARLETIEEEAAYLADWLASARQGPDGVRSCAVLCRKRSQFDAVIDAFEERGIPHEVVGLGGLLFTPEVADLVAVLTVVADPVRGDRLMRLLTGPRCRLGAADLDGLWAWARMRASHARGPAGRDLAADSADAATLTEALDTLPPPGWLGPAGESLSGIALRRLAGLAETLRGLRAMVGLALPELVLEAERALGLDIEVVARPEYSPAAARAHLDAFTEVAASFAASADRPTLGAFVAWLEAALAEERGLELGWLETRSDAVSILTVHAAKGLEWDVVVVPGLVEAAFPAHSGNISKVDAGEWVTTAVRDKAWLVGLAGVPHDLRGDRHGRPRFGWDTAATCDDLASEWTRFTAASAAFGIEEERRLAYVALTRAREAILLTSHVWGTAKTPRITSRFLDEVRAAGAASGPWCPMPATDPVAANPRHAEPVEVLWPPTPELERHRAAAAAAALIRSAPQESVPGAFSLQQQWELSAKALLAERAASHRPRSGESVRLPTHLSTSALVALMDDPVGYAENLRRPMPAPPAPQARRGTRFHAWLEEYFGEAALLEVDELPGWTDASTAGDEDLAALQETFLASPWAALSPLEVETDVETVIGSVAVRGRIDAVFADGDGFVIVDWKTTAAPTKDRLTVLATQLAAYRLAWCRLRGVDEARVRAAFYLARTGETIYPTLPAVEELVRALTGDPVPAQ